MKTNIFLIYAYLVCFVTLSCGAIFTGIILYDIVEISVPDFMMSEVDKQKYLDEQNYIENKKIQPDDKKNTHEIYSDEEITEIRTWDYKSAIDRERNNAIKSIIQSLIILVIDLVLFFVHWRVAERAREK